MQHLERHGWNINKCAACPDGLPLVVLHREDTMVPLAVLLLLPVLYLQHFCASTAHSFGEECTGWPAQWW